MKLKVCGMLDSLNIKELIQLSPDFIGFIFYNLSKRNATHILDPHFTNSIPPQIKKIGVFVDEEIIQIKKIVEKYHLDGLQLHGNELPQYCEEVKKSIPGLNIIKAFGMDDQFDFETLNEYAKCCDYFLFDTKGKSAGGNGIKFNWNILTKYHLKTPYFLSGGIDLGDINDIIKMQKTQPQLYAIDVNSKFELSPGLKDLSKIGLLKKMLQ
ncbi:MAG: phosphoribosylanthranilate isomerase [Bacteroidota bacterium]|nr:phosphoribosylanthranilate isomerase [Bacteroidota bacterium]